MANNYYIATAFGYHGDRQWIFDRLDDALHEIKNNPAFLDTSTEVGITRERLSINEFLTRREQYAATRDDIERNS